MAIKYNFTCEEINENHLSVSESYPGSGIVGITGECNGIKLQFCLNITTAIKFAKTIRTEINRAKEVGYEG